MKKLLAAAALVVSVVVPTQFAGAASAAQESGVAAPAGEVPAFVIDDATPVPPAVDQARERIRAGKPADGRKGEVSASGIDYEGYFINGNGNCLDVYNNTGPQLIHWSCHWGGNQYWRLTKDPNYNQWEIKPWQWVTECADVEGVVGPNVIKFPCTLSSNQLWYAADTGNRTAFFQSYADFGKCLDASGTDSRALSWPCNWQANQQWYLYIP
ncbi:RICIN domain-containing protein [Saccharothrix sp. NPDC042600]|uniref:RICIN domain-containing protein n=1 Tax=Saccharothrix TaxID=2071 RepID=UPI00340DD6B4|nr:hypothetical protein GCM10017745_82210 [Saccharothrix mutabilis subsp. capreolus]